MVDFLVNMDFLVGNMGKERNEAFLLMRKGLIFLVFLVHSVKRQEEKMEKEEREKKEREKKEREKKEKEKMEKEERQRGARERAKNLLLNLPTTFWSLSYLILVFLAKLSKLPWIFLQESQAEVLLNQKLVFPPSPTL